MTDIFSSIKNCLIGASFKHCIDSLRPQLSEPQCLPFLAIGVKYSIEFKMKHSTVTFYAYPMLFSSEIMAEAYTRGFDYGKVFEVDEVRQMLDIEIKE